MRNKTGLGSDLDSQGLSAVLDEVSAILDSTPLVMLLVDSERRVRRINRAVAEFAGRTGEELLGLRGGEALGCLNSLDSPQGCGFGAACEECRVRQTVLDTSDTGRSHSQVEATLTFVRGDKKETKILLVSTSPVNLPDEQLVLVCAEDITERKRMEEDLRKSKRMELLGQVAGGVAHEVRNPLNAILAISEALHQDLEDSPGHDVYLQQIRTQVDRLSRLMQDLLDLGRPLQSSLLERQSIATVCETAVNLWKQSEASKGYEVHIVGPPSGIDTTCSCDIARLQQVFINLLENAAQHSPEGEILLEILESDEGMVRVRVTDRGSGIPPKDIDKVFDPFFTARKGGTGLGLSIVKHIVDVHGGGILIWNNDPPPGCTVEISLPQKGES